MTQVPTGGILWPRSVTKENGLTPSSPRRFKVFVGVAASLAFATLVAVRAMDLLDERAQLLAAGDRRAEGLAVVFAGYLTQTFAAIDASLRQLALHSGRIGGPTASEADWGPALVASRAALNAVGSITVTDSAGVIRHTTQSLVMGQSRRDNYLFRILSTDTADVIVADPPFQSVTSDHAYLIPLGRRLRGPHGEFAGIVVVTFRPEQIRQFFRGADIGKEGTISIFHRDGYVVLREPSGENPIGENASHEPLFEAAAHADLERDDPRTGLAERSDASNGRTARCPNESSSSPSHSANTNSWVRGAARRKSAPPSASSRPSCWRQSSF